MATETDLVNSIAGGHALLAYLARCATDDEPNRAEIHVRMAQLRFSLQENVSRLKKIRTNKPVCATSGEKYFFIDENGYHWTDSPEQRTVASQIDMEKLLSAYFGSDWPSHGIQIWQLPPNSIAW